MFSKQLHGGCLCGAVRYEIDAEPSQVVNCHCTMCRRHSGAPFLTYAAFPSKSIKFLLHFPKSYRSSESAVRRHCEICGSPIDFSFDTDTSVIWVTIGSLDKPELFPATENWFTKSKLSWTHVDKNIPSLLEFPE
jgi:hypothetical protein